MPKKLTVRKLFGIPRVYVVRQSQIKRPQNQFRANQPITPVPDTPWQGVHKCGTNVPPVATDFSSGTMGIGQLGARPLDPTSLSCPAPVETFRNGVYRDWPDQHSLVVFTLIWFTHVIRPWPSTRESRRKQQYDTSNLIMPRMIFHFPVSS